MVPEPPKPPGWPPTQDLAGFHSRRCGGRTRWWIDKRQIDPKGGDEEAAMIMVEVQLGNSS